MQQSNKNIHDEPNKFKWFKNAMAGEGYYKKLDTLRTVIEVWTWYMVGSFQKIPQNFRGALNFHKCSLKLK